MSDKKITQLTASTTPLAGTEVLPVVQSGITKKVAVSDLTAGRNVAMASAVTPIINNTGNVKIQTSGTDRLIVQNSDGFVGINTSAAYQTLTLSIAGVNVPVEIGMRARNASGSDASVASIKTSYDSTGGANGSKLEIATRDGSGVLTGLTVRPNRNVEVNLGNLVIGTAGKGIDFSADAQAAGMTSELLDDYEEGTWTPVPADAASGGNTGTASGAFGTYVKTGNLVFVTCVLVNINTTGLTSGNSFFVQGLPFSSFDMPATTAFYLSGGVLTSSVTISSPVTAYVQDNTSSAATFFDSGGALLVSDLTSGAADFYFSLTYRTA
jgi:hypothetical protein